MVFTLVGCFLWKKKLKITYLLAFLKSLINYEILPVTLVRKFVAAYRKPPVTLEVVSKAACDSKKSFESRQLGNLKQSALVLKVLI